MGKKKSIQQDLFGDVRKEVYPVIKKSRQKLSAAQSEFNRLNKKIAALRNEIRELPEREQIIKTFFAEQVASLFDEERDLVLQLVKHLDAVYEGKMKLTKKEKAILPELILQEMNHIDNFDLSEEQQQYVDEIINKYLDITSGMTHEEREQEAIDIMISLCSLSGVKPTAKMKKAKTEAEFTNAFQEYLNKQMEKEILKEEMNAKKRNSSAQKEKKLSKRELKQKLQEEQTMKSIRTIYIELVKELHPDKETDEETRLLKEERMKQLTKAYQAKDLASLLKMQIEWLEESAVSPETQTDDVLKHYNKLLRSQLERLEDEYYLMCAVPFPGVLGAYGDFRKYRLDVLEAELSAMRCTHHQELGNLRDYIDKISDPVGLKSIIKEFGRAQSFKREKEEEFYDFLDSFMK